MSITKGFFSNNWSKYGFVLGCLGISKLIKVSSIIGSAGVFFSATNAVGPLATVFGGVLGGGIFSLFNILLCGKSFFTITCTGIPQIFAGQYLRTTSKFFQIGIPLLCMALFLTNDVGAQTWQYAMFWLIPMAISILGTENIFMKSLGATFVAHAIGSIIWLYCVPISPAMWLALIPVVPIERLCFASATSCVYLLADYFVKLGSKITLFTAVKKRA